MERKNYYILGDTKNGHAVIRTLVDLGGENLNNLNGNNPNVFYYINPSNNVICMSNGNKALEDLIENMFTRVDVKEYKPVFKDGSLIRKKGCESIMQIHKHDDEVYIMDNGAAINIVDSDDYELIPDRFVIFQTHNGGAYPMLRNTIIYETREKAQEFINLITKEDCNLQKQFEVKRLV